MKLVILPGNSESNRAWAKAAAEAYSSSFSEIYIHNYSHWDTGEEFIDLDTELKKLVEETRDSNYVILAKSAGAMLTVYGVYKKDIVPKKAIFLGFPISWAEQNGFALLSWLQDYNIPTIVIQNTNDPVTSFSDLSAALADKDSANLKLIEIPGEDHKYDNFEGIKRIAENFIN